MMIAQNLSETKFYLTHVHCADCVRDLISDCVMRIEGVASAEFDDKDIALRVTFDGARTSEDEIRRAIKEIGYGFRRPHEQRQADSGRLNTIVIAAVVLFAVILVWWMGNL